MIKYILLLTLILWGQDIKDYDMDGVPDNIDLCSHTPFFDKVNQDGCTTSRLTLPEDIDNNSLNIIVDYGLSYNGDSIEREKIHRSKLEINYYHKDWIYTINTGYINSRYWSDIDDTLLGLKRYFQLSQNIKLTAGIGLKIPTHTFKGNEIDYTILENLSYYPTDTISLFMGSKYIFINDKSQDEKLSNQYSYYFGLGYFILKSLYSDISYDRTKSKFEDQHLINTISTRLFYQINRSWFTSISYSHEILDDDLHNSTNFRVGYSF